MNRKEISAQVISSPPNGKNILNKALNMSWRDELHDKYPQMGLRLGRPILPTSCEALAGRGSKLSFRTTISCFYRDCQKLLLSGKFKHPHDFLLHLSASCRLLEVERTLDPPGSLAENHCPMGLATGVWISRRLISLHYATQHMLSPRTTWENSNIDINAISVAKKNTFLPQHNTSYKSLGFLRQGSHQRIDIRAALQNRADSQQQGRDAASPVHGEKWQISSYIQDSYLESWPMQPSDHSLHLPQRSLPCLFLLVFGAGINTCLHSDSARVFLFLSVLQERKKTDRRKGAY